MATLSIALLQMASHGFDQDANLAKGVEFCKEAASEGADIVLFPEMWNIGYTGYHAEALARDYDPARPKYPELREEWKQHAVEINRLRQVGSNHQI